MGPAMAATITNEIRFLNGFTGLSLLLASEEQIYENFNDYRDGGPVADHRNACTNGPREASH